MVYIRTKTNQVRHDVGVGNIAKQVVLAGWNFVRSDLRGNTKPPRINGFIPDVYVAHYGRQRVIEVETTDSINTQHALQQKAAFQRWVNASPTTRSFEIRLA